MAQKKKSAVKAKATKAAVPAKKPTVRAASTPPSSAVQKRPSAPVPAAKPPVAKSAATAKPPVAKALSVKAAVGAAKPAAKAAVPAAKAAPVAAKAVKAGPAKAAPLAAAGKPATAIKPAAAVKPAVAAPSPAAKSAVKPSAGAAAFAAHRAAAQAAASAPRAVPALSKPASPKLTAAPRAPNVPAAPVTPKAIAEKAAAARQMLAAQKKPVSQRHGFKTNEFIVYPAHGVGRIIGIEEQEIAGISLELFVINFEKEKLTLRVPTGKLETVGMRKLADDDIVKKAMEVLKGRARVKRTMWSRRAQEYVAKINSGDLISIAEVVRDLYRSEAQPEQSYSERQLYEDALDRMAREIAAVEKLDDRGAVQRITEVLSKSARGRRMAEEGETEEVQAA